jgi:hypothetical protein
VGTRNRRRTLRDTRRSVAVAASLKVQQRACSAHLTNVHLVIQPIECHGELAMLRSHGVDLDAVLLDVDRHALARHTWHWHVDADLVGVIRPGVIANHRNPLGHVVLIDRFRCQNLWRWRDAADRRVVVCAGDRLLLGPIPFALAHAQHTASREPDGEHLVERENYRTYQESGLDRSLHRWFGINMFQM